MIACACAVQVLSSRAVLIWAEVQRTISPTSAPTTHDHNSLCIFLTFSLALALSRSISHSSSTGTRTSAAVTIAAAVTMVATREPIRAEDGLNTGIEAAAIRVQVRGRRSHAAGATPIAHRAFCRRHRRRHRRCHRRRRRRKGHDGKTIIATGTADAERASLLLAHHRVHNTLHLVFTSPSVYQPGNTDNENADDHDDDDYDDDVS